jgi:hypothetical protein
MGVGYGVRVGVVRAFPSRILVLNNLKHPIPGLTCQAMAYRTANRLRAGEIGVGFCMGVGVIHNSTHKCYTLRISNHLTHPNPGPACQAMAYSAAGRLRAGICELEPGIKMHLL